MSVKVLSKLSSEAKNPVNNYADLNTSDTITLVPGAVIPVIAWKVPDRINWFLPEDPKVQMKLKDDAGNDLPDDTKVILSAKSPADVDDVPLGDTEYRIFAELSLAEQRNSQYADACLINTDSDHSFAPGEYIIIKIKLPTTASVTTFSWANSVFTMNVLEEQL